MLTVLFATRNRAETLAAVLEHYTTLKEPSGGWKLVIVDNGSTAQTGELICSYQQRLPLTYLFEPQPGKNVALNSGLARISGDLILFTDDDAFPYPDWLIQMRTAADTHPDYTIFGGTVIPRWQSPPDSRILAWAPPGVTFTISNPLTKEGPTTSHTIFGPNMAVRADVFAAGFRFDPNVGPRGVSYAMGSETEFLRRLVDRGFRSWYCRDATVEHLIPRSHMRMSWILSRAIRFGRGQYRMAHFQHDPLFPFLLGMPRYILRQIFLEQGRILMALFALDREKLFRARWQLNYLWGQAIEARVMRAEAASVDRVQTFLPK